MITLVRLDRQGVLYDNTPTTGRTGASTNVLTEICRLPVGRVNVSSKTIISGARDASDTEDVFQTRWIPGMRPGLFITVENIQYRITKVSELGRRKGWQIYGKAVA